MICEESCGAPTLTHTVRQQTGGVLRAEEVAAGGAEEGQILVLDDDLS